MPRRLFNCPVCNAFLIDMEEKAAVAEPAGWPEIALLLSALPVLAPSLALSWLDPKRLGRGQLLVHAAGALAVLAWLWGGSLSLSLWVLSAGAGALLATRRIDDLERGGVLGFPTAAALRLVAGMLFIAGLGSVETWYQLGRTLDFARSDTATVADLLGARGKAGGSVTLNGAEPDDAGRLWRAEARGGTRFFRIDPRTPVAARSPQELVDLSGELLGLEVDAGAIAPGPDRYLRKDVTFKGDGPAERDRATRSFGEVPGTGGQLWIASAPMIPGQETAQFPRPGLLVQVYNDAAFAGERLSRSQEELPAQPLAVLGGVRLGATGVESWTPVKGTDRRLWIAAPPDAAAQGGGSLTGVVLPGYWAAKTLREHLGQHGGEAPGEIVVLNRPGTQGFNEYAADRLSVTMTDFKIVLVPIVLLLTLGIVFLAAGVRPARRVV